MRFLAVLLLLASNAWAGPAEDAALKANQVRDVHCAEMAADRTSSMTSALVAVAPVLDEVSRVYEQTKAPYLLYWRGVLLQCSGQEARATEDLDTFVSDPGNQRYLPSLLIPVGAGVGVRLGDALGFRAQVRLDVAPNQVPELGGEALVGISGVVGGAFQLGEIPLEIRPEATVGVLGSFFHFSAGLGVGGRLGG